MPLFVDGSGQVGMQKGELARAVDTVLSSSFAY